MDIFQKLLTALSSEEQRTYKLLCGRSHSTKDRKDIALFNYAQKAGDNYDESYILKKLYKIKNGDKNALYRLKNKVKSDVQRSLSYLNYDESHTIIALNNIILFEHFVLCKKYDLALHYLNRAEEAAERSENYRLLEFIYGAVIELSQVHNEFNPLTYIAKRKQNERKLAMQNSMEEIYTRLNYNLKISFNYSREKITSPQFFKQQLAGYDKVKELKNNAAFRIKIFKTLAQALVQQHNYRELLKYSQESLEQFEKRGWLKDEHLEVRFQMLIYICNALYKLGRYFDSLKSTAELKTELEASTGPWKDKYSFFYQSLLIYNYIKTDPAKAVEICNKILQQLKTVGNPQLEYVTLINKAIAQTEANQYDNALGTMNRVFINDYFRKSDASFKMKIFMAEIQVYYLAGDYKFCEQRFRRFVKQYSALLAKKDYAAEAQLTDIVSLMLKRAINKAYNKPLLMQKVDAFLKAKGNPAEEDTQIFTYKVWVRNYARQFNV